MSSFNVHPVESNAKAEKVLYNIGGIGIIIITGGNRKLL